MKKVKVKRFEPTSVFKTVLMAVTIPFLIFFGLALLVGLFGINSARAGFLPAMVMPFIIMPVIYGLIFMLLAASYNWLAPKFEGLELIVEEENIIEENENEK